MGQQGEGRIGAGLGTFAGVFTPSVLTILGLILFLRMGYVVGSVGLVRALAIILIANSISVLTSISLSAIATNLRVKGGGDYYVISRTLGVEYGGALGLVLFLAQSVSVAFYAIGFGEAVATMTGIEAAWLTQVIAAVAVAALFVLAWLGADWATRFQYVVMVVLFLAIAGFFVGGALMWDGARLAANLQPAGNFPFWMIFATFFPAVTGFTQGVSMSGDLADPGRSLPRGTFLAVGLSLLVYLAVAVVFAAAVPGSVLAEEFGAMRRVSIFAWLVDAGVIAATLSSALASFLGAPRILQSLASDRVFPVLDLFAVGHGGSGNPRRGVLLTAAIAFVTVSLGNLNVIAPVVAMFFLISYGLLNYATYFEARANSPSFRPRFRFFHARASLAGGLICLGAMLAINATAAAIAVVVLFAIHQYVSRTVSVERWADSARSHRLQRVRDDLHAISGDLEHTRDWRPVLLAFSDDPGRRERILRFSSWLEGRAGFTTIVRMLPGEGAHARRTRKEAEAELRAEINRVGLPAFGKAVITSDVERALPVLLQSHGLGRVRANTVLLNWFDAPNTEGSPGLTSYGHYLRLALRYGCNVVILSGTSHHFARLDEQRARDRRIDVWYRDNATGRLMLLLAYLMTRSEEWSDARIRLLAPAARDRSHDETRAQIEEMLRGVRIEAEAEIVDPPAAREVLRASADASAVFLPFRLEDDGPTSTFDCPLDALLRELGLTAVVLASQDIVLDSDPEEGRHGEIARAVDEAEKTEQSAARTAREAAETSEAAKRARAELAAARAEGADEEQLEQLTSEMEREAEKAERARRRAARSRAKADQAAEEADNLTGGERD